MIRGNRSIPIRDLTREQKRLFQTFLGCKQVTNGFVVDLEHAEFEFVLDHVASLVDALKQEADGAPIQARVLQTAFLKSDCVVSKAMRKVPDTHSSLKSNLPVRSNQK